MTQSMQHVCQRHLKQELDEKARLKKDRRTPGIPYNAYRLALHASLHAVPRLKSCLRPSNGTQNGHSQPLKEPGAPILHARTRRALAARGATPTREALNGAKSACSSVTAQKPFKHLSESPPLREDLLFSQASFGDLGLEAIEQVAESSAII